MPLGPLQIVALSWNSTPVKICRTFLQPVTSE